jgi:VanZ family protein
MGKNRRASDFLPWLAVLLWAGLIFYLSSQPDVKLPGREFYLKDKLVHAFAYAVLCAFVIMGSRTSGSRDLARGVGLTSVIAYGFFDEIHQRFVPGRLCDPVDFVSDAFGALAVFILVYSWEAWRKRRTHDVQIAQGDS